LRARTPNDRGGDMTDVLSPRGTPPDPRSDHDLKESIASQLGVGRERTLGLVDPFSEEELLRSPSRLMSPLVWDLGHCANYEELWLLRQIAGHDATDPLLDDIYNA